MVFDRLWDSGGWISRVEGEEGSAHFELGRSLYTDEVKRSLPLAEVTSVDPLVGLVRAAGFGQVEVVGVPEIERVEREITEYAEHSPYFVLVASKPA